MSTRGAAMTVYVLARSELGWTRGADFSDTTTIDLGERRRLLQRVAAALARRLPVKELAK